MDLREHIARIPPAAAAAGFLCPPETNPLLEPRTAQRLLIQLLVPVGRAWQILLATSSNAD